MGKYVLLDASNVVKNAIVWDGVTPVDFGSGITAHVLPDPPPFFHLGDTYDPNTDTVTPRSATASETAQQNLATLNQKAQAALANNATFMALGSPTNAQTLAQVQSLTKQVNALIRLATQALSTISDT